MSFRAGIGTPRDARKVLASDLVSDLGQEHKFVSQEEKVQIQTNASDIENLKENKQDKLLVMKNVYVNSWEEDTTYSDYPYRASIENSHVTAATVIYVIFNVPEATSGDYAPICQTENGVIYIYSKVNTNITIPTIKEI